MPGTPTDTRGIVAADALMERVRFRRHPVAPELRRYVEFYWFIDWDLTEPYTSRVVPHPAVNIPLQRFGDGPAIAEVSGVGRDLFSITLDGTGRVCGAKFRPGAFRAFHDGPVSALTDRRVPLAELFPDTAFRPEDVLDHDDEAVRVKAMDSFLCGLSPVDDPAAVRTVALMERVRDDRALKRVEDVAAVAGLSVRALQRLFAEYVGVSPKWVIRRYRLHDAVAHAATGTEWSRLARELGYSDQAHLVRDFTAMLGTPPAAFARALADCPDGGARTRDPA